MSDASTKPTHNICAQLEERGNWHQLGVGWLNPETGVMAIKFNPFLDLGRLGSESKVRAFPWDHKQRMQERQSKKPFEGARRTPGPRHDPEPPPDDGPDFGDDDIPF